MPKEDPLLESMIKYCTYYLLDDEYRKAKAAYKEAYRLAPDDDRVVWLKENYFPDKKKKEKI